MIPLGLEPGGSVVVNGDQRRAWICSHLTCVHTLCENPHRAKRRFGSKVQITNALLTQAEAHHIARLKTLLLRAHREGLLVLGPSKTIQVSDHLAAILVSANGEPNTRTQLASRFYPGRTFIFPLSSTQIGDLLARGPRSMVGIRPGRTTQSLLDGLRMWHSVG